MLQVELITFTILLAKLLFIPVMTSLRKWIRNAFSDGAFFVSLARKGKGCNTSNKQLRRFKFNLRLTMYFN
jgi:hypothetical protein